MADRAQDQRHDERAAGKAELEDDSAGQRDGDAAQHQAHRQSQAEGEDVNLRECPVRIAKEGAHFFHALTLSEDAHAVAQL